MSAAIQLQLYATLKPYYNSSSELFPIQSGISVRQLIAELKIPEKEAKLIFINGIKSELDDVLYGGERVGIFPPVGGG